MIEINTFDEYLQLFEGPGWVKTHTSNGYICRATSDIGKGSVKIWGDTKRFCYIKLAFSYTTDNACLFSVEEPYIEISNNVEDTITLDDAGSPKLAAEHGLNCHINLGKLKVNQIFPANTKFWKESLIIREEFLREELPALIEKELFNMAGAIRSGGLSDPRIAVLFKQLDAFPLTSDYGQNYLLGKVYETVALLQDKVNQVQWNDTLLSSAEVNRLKEAIFFLKTHYRKPLRITELTKQFELNRNKMQMGFHTLTGYTVHECLLNIRVQEAITLLITTTRTVPEIAECVGFGSAKSLYEAFSKFLGIPPNYFRKALHK
jgi:AraC-like DNA-binding protein